MNIHKLAELKEAAEKATPGPYFTDYDDAEDCPDHKQSGLAMVETGRTGDWWIARLVEWPTAKYIAKADPQTVLDLITEVERQADLISDVQHHHLNGCRNNAKFMADWLKRAAQRE